MIDADTSKPQAVIDPNKKYGLQEIADKQLIPGVTGYQTVYQMVTIKLANGKRIPCKKTTKTSIEPTFKQRPGAKIAGKLYVSGKELIHFLQIHLVLPSAAGGGA